MASVNFTTKPPTLLCLDVFTMPLFSALSTPSLGLLSFLNATCGKRAFTSSGSPRHLSAELTTGLFPSSACHRGAVPFGCCDLRRVSRSRAGYCTGFRYPFTTYATWKTIYTLPAFYAGSITSYYDRTVTLVCSSVNWNEQPANIDARKTGILGHWTRDCEGVC